MPLTTAQFIEKARNIHGDIYEYYLVEYINSRTKVKIICKEHGVFEQIPNNHLNGQRCPNSTCVAKKRKQTNFERYGVEHALQSKNIQEKYKQTCLERYGVEYPAQNKEVQEKYKQTNLLIYGVEYPAQNKKVQEKQKQTNLDRYGAENPSQNERVQNKKKQTSLDRYGVESPRQNHYSRDTLNKLNSFEYLHNEYIDKNRTTIQIAEELNIDPNTVCNYLRRYNIPVFKMYASSKIAIQWLESISKEQSIHIQHAGNIGEYRIPGTRLLVDGYCKDNNTIYEFYGDCWHGNLSIYKEEDRPHPFNPDITTIDLYNKTMERESRIKELGYKVETIWESDLL